MRGFADGAAVDGPEAAEDAEKGGFAAAIGADNEEVVARLDGETEGADKDVAVRGDDGDIGEFDVGAFDDGATVAEDVGVGGGRGGADEALFVVASGDVIHDVEEGRDARGVAGEFGDLFIGEHDAADGVG